MKAKLTALATALLMGCMMGQAQVADSVDVLDYDVSLDLSGGTPFTGVATLQMRLLRPCASIGLELIGTADSVRVGGVRVESPNLAVLPTAGIAPGDTFALTVWYRGHKYVESGDFGGFHFDASVHYNLACGFNEDPHSMGRAVFPCRDNFHDKATYTLRLKSKAGWTAECSGMLVGREVDGEGCEQSVWRIDKPVSTYLVGVSQANWYRQQDTVSSLYGDYPLTMSTLWNDGALVQRAFAQLDSVVPMFERCFGPYRWERIGYIGTPNGSMEHVNNIALYRPYMTGMEERAQSTMAHELGHAWFGNLVTCSTEGDMWINEGGASFTSEVAMESVQGRAAATDYYQRNLESVLRQTHLTDRGYRALHGMSHRYTYGSTTYDKGWMVWHSLRGYLGDTLFYASVRRMLDEYAFGNMDAYQVRDALSRYSGVDLCPFFQFHVFTPGFVDYQVWMERVEGSGREARIFVRQQGVATEELAGASRVPVMFYSREGESEKRWVVFDGAEHSELVTLPFEPAGVVLDRDCEISDAATLGVAALSSAAGVFTLPVAHIDVSSSQRCEVFVEHHYALPTGTMPEGVVRAANRYWVVNINGVPEDVPQGRFHYVRTGWDCAYTSLDRGFYSVAATADSLALLYRPTPTDEWRVVSLQRGGNANQGYLATTGGMPGGQYTLAVVDPARVGLGCAQPQSIPSLFPNPLGRGEGFSVSVPTEHPFAVTIFDAEGRRVWQETGCVNGLKLRPALAKGTYLVRIENNFVSLQSKLIQL